MNGLDRRAFLGASIAGLAALGGPGAAVAAISDSVFAGDRAAFDLAAARNLAAFLPRTDTVGLVGLLGVRTVAGHPRRGLFLFPFTSSAFSADVAAFLPGDGGLPVRTAAMTPGGLPPDEYLCNYVLGVPRENFISFSLGKPLVNGAQNHPWQGNLVLRGTSVGIGWTSSNLNHPWFAGSRWIPERGEGARWRAHVIEELRRLANLELPEAVA